MREHLEEILQVARTFMFGFGLSAENSPATNRKNFQTARHLSAYLHLHFIPKSPQDSRVSLCCPAPHLTHYLIHSSSQRIMFAYMNPVLLQVIKQAIYSAPNSIARKTFALIKQYPGLKRHSETAGLNWKEGIPLNAFVMGAVAVRLLACLLTIATNTMLLHHSAPLFIYSDPTSYERVADRGISVTYVELNRSDTVLPNSYGYHSQNREPTLFPGS
jgi:hypothetical protein